MVVFYAVIPWHFYCRLIGCIINDRIYVEIDDDEILKYLLDDNYRGGSDLFNIYRFIPYSYCTCKGTYTLSAYAYTIDYNPVHIGLIIWLVKRNIFLTFWVKEIKEIGTR